MTDGESKKDKYRIQSRPDLWKKAVERVEESERLRDEEMKAIRVKKSPGGGGPAA
jgi:hypothetical protein